MVRQKWRARIMGLVLFEHLLLVLSVNDNNNTNEFNRQDFPSVPQFVFGAGSSAYQSEGAALEDGRTPSIWDSYVHNVNYQLGNGDVTVDAYHKYKEDVQLMVETGLEAYRFSISWSRLIPYGRGPINPKALQFYNSLIDQLVINGIEPHVTLYHHDYPQALEDEYGGWLSRQSTKDFVAFADVCFREFGDRVLHWTTINEPNAIALISYDTGLTAPGRCSSPFGWAKCSLGNSSFEPYLVAHNILLAHTSVSRLYRQKYKQKHGMIGLNLIAPWFKPLTNVSTYVVSAEIALDFWIGWFLHPLVHGDYPEIMKKRAGRRIPVFTKKEIASIKDSIDFLALNHYDTFYTRDKSSTHESDNRDVFADMAVEFVALDRNSAPYELGGVDARGLQPLLEYIKCNYGNLPIYIHENGYNIKRNGTLNDNIRVDVLRGFMGGLLNSVRNGSDVRGYFIWSFLDLFEILDGWNSSYGLYYVDLDDKDLKRQPKTSAKWYTNFLKGSSNLALKDAI